LLSVVVDRYEGTIADAKTGAAYSDEAVVALREAIQRARVREVLGEEDSKALVTSGSVLVALKTLGSLGEDCVHAEFQGESNVGEFWWTLTNCDREDGFVQLPVDAVTGQIRTLDGTGGVIELPEIERDRQRIFNELRLRKGRAEAYVRTRCGVRKKPL
jgi:hypothetical protein